MTDRQAMQQALDIMTHLANFAGVCEATHHAKKDQHTWSEPCPIHERLHEAVQALKDRLAQQEGGND